MKKNLLVSISAALAACWASAALVACSGDDTTSNPSLDAGSDSTVSEGGKPDADAAVTTRDADAAVTAPDADATATTPDADAAATTEGGGPDADAASIGDAPAPSDAGDAAPSDSGDGGPPPPPTLGAQIDRFGRPAINTALNHSFDSNSATAGTAKDTYNADNVESNWTSYKAEFAKNLAILDSLDTTDTTNGCGNQLFAQADAGAGRYDTFAGVLANDRMWVNTAATNCSQYFGVELIATGVLAADAGPDGGPTNECGGRKLTYDVIQTTYSAAALGTVSGFGSGVSAVASKTSGTTFPYLAPPQ
jgi:hypothetical protein